MLIKDLKETFENLNKWKWKLNPKQVCFRGTIRITTQIPGQ
jgi:hypothetical protein